MATARTAARTETASPADLAERLCESIQHTAKFLSFAMCGGSDSDYVPNILSKAIPQLWLDQKAFLAAVDTRKVEQWRAEAKLGRVRFEKVFPSFADFINRECEAVRSTIFEITKLESSGAPSRGDLKKFMERILNEGKYSHNYHFYERMDALVKQDWPSIIAEVRGELIEWAAASGKQTRRRRGAPQADAATVKSEAELLARWERFKGKGGTLKDFAKVEGMQQKELERRLDTAGTRRRRSAK